MSVKQKKKKRERKKEKITSLIKKSNPDRHLTPQKSGRRPKPLKSHANAADKGRGALGWIKPYGI
jgi:hypothetical protein